MDMSDYQRKAASFAVYKKHDGVVSYPFLGLASEVGEVLGVVKKIKRGDHGADVAPATRQKISDELGDTLWYLSECAREMGLDLAEVARQNIEKLTSRDQRGTIRGDGDDR